MGDLSARLKKGSTLLSVLELRRLLFDIRDRRPDVYFRYRMLGEMWVQSFCRIIHITEKGAVFQNESDNGVVVISDLDNIMQFEIDNAFLGFQPYFHYDVCLYLEDQG